MKTRPVTPYLLPPESAVSEQPWTTADGRALPDRLEHWDPFTDLEVLRIEIDADTLREACRMGPDAAFAVTASWHSSRTRLAASSKPVELGQLKGLARIPLALRVPGAASGGRLDLRTRVVVRSPGSKPSPISPKREGAVLWMDETRVALEGSASRFPVTAADFRAVQRLPDEGSWVVEWDQDKPDAPVLGGLRLVVNSADEALLGSLRSGSTDPRSAVIRSFVMYDVARTLVHGALRNDRFLTDPESFEDASVGRLQVQLISLCWPGLPISALAVRNREDPPRLDAELQAFLGVLR